MATEEKKDIEEKLEKKDENKPIWKTLSPGVLIGIIIMIILLVRNMQMDGGNKNFMMILGAIGVIYLLTHQTKPAERLVNPREAELLAEREVERKLRPEWGQFPIMAKYRIGPVSDLMHRDARGIYYNIGVTIKDPYVPGYQYYTAKVMASGNERGFTTLIKSTGELDGKDIHHERDVTKIPEYIKLADRYNIFQKLWMR